MFSAHDRSQKDGMLTKNSYRTQISQQLDSISFFDLIQKSEALRENFLQKLIAPNLAVIQGKAVVTFYPFGPEPQINIESEKMDEPYRVAYMRIDNWPQRQMSAALARRDQPGQWLEVQPIPEVKIFQPTASQPTCKDSEIALILVPGVAFSPKTGARLGRGAGFYDRFLAAHSSVLRVGLAFREQLADVLPCDEWDIPVDMLLTDENLQFPAVCNPKRFSAWQKHGKILTEG
jgi:5-formyltetrahydrofolate cyclo-ligase